MASKSTYEQKIVSETRNRPTALSRIFAILKRAVTLLNLDAYISDVSARNTVQESQSLVHLAQKQLWNKEHVS